MYRAATQQTVPYIALLHSRLQPAVSLHVAAARQGSGSRLRTLQGGYRCQPEPSRLGAGWQPCFPRVPQPAGTALLLLQACAAAGHAATAAFQWSACIAACTRSPAIGPTGHLQSAADQCCSGATVRWPAPNRLGADQRQRLSTALCPACGLIWCHSPQALELCLCWHCTVLWRMENGGASWSCECTCHAAHPGACPVLRWLAQVSSQERWHRWHDGNTYVASAVQQYTDRRGPLGARHCSLAAAGLLPSLG